MSNIKDELKNDILARRQKLSPDKQKLLQERLDGQFSQSISQRLLVQIDEMMSDALIKYGSEALERLQQSIAIFKGGKKPAGADPRQVADNLFIPGLCAKPWHNPEDFKWVPTMEGSFDVIRKELLALLKTEVEFNPYQHPYTKELGWNGWGTYSLYRTNTWDEERCQLCPETVKAIGQTPHGLRECMFTKLHPGSHITPHSGGSNVVIFDDSYMHEVWHKGTETRMVLLWDIWHPDLTEIEVDVLKMIFPIIDKYLENSAKV